MSAEFAKRMADRLRMAADEIESASRYGLPIPYCITVDGHEFGRASFSATEDEFAAWAYYTEARVEHYEYGGVPWSKAAADVNGLPLEFSVKRGGAA